MIKTIFKWSVLILIAGWVIGQFMFFPLAFHFLAVILFILIYVSYKLVKLLFFKGA